MTMARQTNTALACLLFVPVFLGLTAGVVCAATLVLATADSRPTAFLALCRFGHGKKLDLLTRIKEVSPPLEAVPTYLALTKVRDLSRQSEGFDAALASMKQDGTYDRIIGQYP
jgi:hypothetical protein